MARTGRCFLMGVLGTVVCAALGCQINNKTREIRAEEQMLAVTFENERAEDLFMKAAKTTYGDVQNVKRFGVPGLSVYSRGETVAWNANCNDHIHKMDTDLEEQECALNQFEHLRLAQQPAGLHPLPVSQSPYRQHRCSCARYRRSYVTMPA